MLNRQVGFPVPQPEPTAAEPPQGEARVEPTDDVAGPRRLLFGTDSSYFPRGWHAQIFETQSKALYEIGVDADTARLIFHDNLEQLFS